MPFHVFMVFAMSVGFFSAGVGILERIAHLHWFTRQALRFWVSLLTGGLGIVVLGYLSATQLPPEKWGPAVVLGAIVGTLLRVTAKPKRPTTAG
jgi:hypothetical protein